MSKKTTHPLDFINALTARQKQELLAILTTLNIEPKTEINKEVKAKPIPKKTKVNDDFSVSRNFGPKVKTSVKAEVSIINSWVDTGESREIVTPEYQASSRERKPPKKVELTCHVCKRLFTISPSLVYGENTRCNRCTGH